MPAAKPPYRAPSAASAPAKPRGVVVRRPGDPDEAELGSLPKRVEPVDPDAGVFSGLVSPHPSSTPAEWWAQVALTILGLPLLVPTFVMVGWLDARRVASSLQQNAQQTPRPMGIAHPAAWLLGALPLGLVFFAHEVHWAFTALAIGVPFAALYTRRRLRAAILDRDRAEALLRARKRV